MSQQFILLLRKKGLKATHKRLLILELFLKKCNPLSAEDIVLILKDIDQATIYRTLHSLEQADILRKVDLRKKATFYELREVHHHHIVCSGCSLIESFEMCKVEEISKFALHGSKNFASINDHSLEFFGYCNECSKQLK